jgi:hypothetical protein
MEFREAIGRATYQVSAARQRSVVTGLEEALARAVATVSGLSG